jgi:peptidoglycan/LPS O-acetylase OafA/YrhL
VVALILLVGLLATVWLASWLVYLYIEEPARRRLTRRMRDRALPLRRAGSDGGERTIVVHADPEPAKP